MSFGQNHQYLRKQANMTQEDLAEQMGVSRQTGSKWESDGAFPEMEKLIAMTSEMGRTPAATFSIFNNSDLAFPEMQDENGEDTTVIDEVKTVLGDLSGSVAGMIEQFTNILNRFVEATAVMIVTTCLIPVLVILFFAWVVKCLFDIQIVIPARPPKLKKLKPAPDAEKEELSNV